MKGYVLSFAFVGVYWVNHHHLLHTISKVTGGMLWANIHLLFWLSLIPIATEWMGETHFAANPVAAYAILLLCCGMAFTILQLKIEKMNKDNSRFFHAFKFLRIKGFFSIAAYSVAFVFAYVLPIVSESLFVLVALVWFIPDKNIEKALKDE
jgi:uncharacterized membrane protein